MTQVETLTRAEAIAYVKAGSDRTFRRWCQSNQVKTVGMGLFARVHLDNGIRRMIRNAK